MEQNPIRINEWEPLKGLQAYFPNGRPMMKCVAIFRERAGKKVYYRHKPAWRDGNCMSIEGHDEFSRGIKY